MPPRLLRDQKIRRVEHAGEQSQPVPTEQFSVERQAVAKNQHRPHQRQAQSHPEDPAQLLAPPQPGKQRHPQRRDVVQQRGVSHAGLRKGGVERPMVQRNQHPAQHRQRQPASVQPLPFEGLPPEKRAHRQRGNGHAVKRHHRAGRIGPARKNRGKAQRKHPRQQAKIGQNGFFGFDQWESSSTNGRR